MGDDHASEDVATLRDEAAAEADECRHTLAGMGDLAADPERHAAAYDLAMQRLAPEREAAFQAEAQAEARVNNNPVDAEQVAAAAEALEQAQEAARARPSVGCASTRTCWRRSTAPSRAR